MICVRNQLGISLVSASIPAETPTLGYSARSYATWCRCGVTCIDLKGSLAISFRPDPAFANGLNIPGIFTGTIINRENIGKTSNELVTRWNEEFPDDQVVFSEN
jgi:hypothetical protein